ncbi:hypothetical protein V8E53_002994 [Lactarius tabidus]
MLVKKALLTGFLQAFEKAGIMELPALPALQAALTSEGINILLNKMSILSTLQDTVLSNMLTIASLYLAYHPHPPAFRNTIAAMNAANPATAVSRDVPSFDIARERAYCRTLRTRCLHTDHLLAAGAEARRDAAGHAQPSPYCTSA